MKFLFLLKPIFLAPLGEFQISLNRVDNLETFLCIGDFDGRLHNGFKNARGSKIDLSSCIGADHKRILTGSICIHQFPTYFSTIGKLKNIGVRLLTVTGQKESGESEKR